MTDLTLIFPQWQGSIDNEALYSGAHELAENIPGLPSPKEVEVAPFYTLPEQHPIAGKDDIVKQLHLANTILDAENPDRILLLGGDCSTEAAPATWLNRKHGGDMALVWLDAHPDLNTPETSQSGRLQGMALAVLLGLGGEELNAALGTSFDCRQVFSAGQRVFDPPELEYMSANKIFISGPGELERDPSWLAKQIKSAGFTRVYIHLDVDAVNPMGFPHSKPSPPAGLLFGHLLKAIEEIDREVEICGLGITEFHPGNARGIEKAAELINKTLRNFLKE
ncbi:arginase family protein [Maridesulfovibrio sp. FT414]|uniref:arginase family protein n=1 Tax=Maridesulfovibrio sp. FT414 TaxID=2979469 RepID=UPI003D8078D2